MPSFPPRIIMAILISILLPASAMTQQKQDRSIERQFWRNEPVRITKLQLKKRLVEFRKKFMADDDWWRGLTLNVTNTSGKAIALITVELDFPRPADENSPESQSPLLAPIAYGRDPAFVESASPNERPKLILPGDTVEIALSDVYYDGLNGILKKLNYRASIKRIIVGVGEVIFEDGTKWTRGAMFRRDPSNPSRWYRAEDLEVTGRVAPLGADLIGLSTIFLPVNFNVEKPVLIRSPIMMKTLRPTQLRCGKFIENQTIICSPQASCVATSHIVDFNSFDVLSPAYQVRNKTVFCVYPADGLPCSFSTQQVQEAYYCDPDPVSGGPCDYSSCSGNPSLDLGSPCCDQTPILIDVVGNGFALTDPAGGVNFDLRPGGSLERLAWTAPSADDAFLSLDRNGNGTIDNVLPTNASL